MFFYLIPTLNWNFWPSGKFFQTRCYNCSLSVHSVILEKFFFSNTFSSFKNCRHWAIKNRPSAKKFRPLCQKYFLRVQAINPEKNGILLFLIVSGHCAKFVWPFVKVFSADMSELNTIFFFMKDKKFLSKKMLFISFWNFEGSV